MSDIDLTISDTALVDAIVEAAEALDEPRAKALADELIKRVRASHELLPVEDAWKVLTALRRQRYLGAVDRVADTLIQTGIRDTRVRRDYVQALIDQGSRTAAIHMLQGLLADATDEDPMKDEARGLLGRAYKQLYVDARQPEMERNRELLRKSLEHYRSVCDDAVVSPNWHAINVVALLKRARRDGVEIEGSWPSADNIAVAILRPIESFDGEPGVWDIATALEACVALGRVKDASRWAKKYAASSARAFELGSTLRQLEEVWGLSTRDEMGAAVLPLLRDGLLRKDKGFFTVSAEEVRQPVESLEKVLGTEAFQTITWYRNGLARAQAVARIGRDVSRGDGTGFLVRGGALHPSLGDELLLLTNAHVISTDPAHRPAVPRFQDALVTFEAAGGSADRDREYRITQVIAVSGPSEYDFALVRLDPAFAADPAVVPYELASDLPMNDGNQRVFIIGHPSGGTLSFSMQDNLLLDYDDRLVHYRAPTEGGSSGSPVFNIQWRLIGLHHAGFTSVNKLNNKGGTYAANEGISIFAIREELKRQLGA
jgi:S1-C subfamily serine protease